MKSQEKNRNISGAILREKFFLKQLALFIPLIFFLLCSVENGYAQSIPGTGTSAGICGNCNPTGWSDADPNLDGTPDISNRTQAGGTGTLVYDWNGNVTAGGDLLNAAPGSYTLTVTDDFGCQVNMDEPSQ